MTNKSMRAMYAVFSVVFGYSAVKTYVEQSTIMWGAVLGFLFCVREILLWELASGEFVVTKPFREMRRKEKWFYSIRKFGSAVSFTGLLCLILFREAVAFHKLTIVFIGLTLVVIALDLVCYYERKKDRHFMNDGSV